MHESRDKRIKYRDLRFKKELEKARQYKRLARHLPETKFEILLSRLCLGSWQSKLLLILVFCGLVYLVFIPNFLFIKSYEVQGERLAHEAEHRQVINGFLTQSRVWPQKNLLLLSSSALKKKLATESWIISVDSIQKIWPNRFVVKVNERREFALVETPGARYIFSNDGKKLETLDSSSTPPSSLLILKTPASLKPEQEIPSASLELIKILQNKIPEICQATVSFYIFYPDINPDLEAVAAAGYKLIFDTSLDNKETFENLSVLLGKLSPEEKNRLAYIDLRIKNKAYICLKGTSCTEALKFKSPFSGSDNSTSSASSTLIIP